MQTTSSQGEKLVIYMKKNPAVRGRKNPISHLSRIKNPKLPCLFVVVALQAYSYVFLLRCFELLGNYCFLY
jgi:hypothetical protein